MQFEKSNANSTVRQFAIQIKQLSFEMQLVCYDTVSTDIELSNALLECKEY